MRAYACDHAPFPWSRTSLGSAPSLPAGPFVLCTTYQQTAKTDGPLPCGAFVEGAALPDVVGSPDSDGSPEPDGSVESEPVGSPPALGRPSVWATFWNGPGSDPVT